MKLDIFSLSTISQELAGAMLFELQKQSGRNESVAAILQLLDDFQTRNVYKDEETGQYAQYRLDQLSFDVKLRVISGAFLLLKQKKTNLQKTIEKDRLNVNSDKSEETLIAKLKEKRLDSVLEHIEKIAEGVRAALLQKSILDHHKTYIIESITSMFKSPSKNMPQSINAGQAPDKNDDLQLSPKTSF